jgi:hypothetical protein
MADAHTRSVAVLQSSPPAASISPNVALHKPRPLAPTASLACIVLVSLFSFWCDDSLVCEVRSWLSTELCFARFTYSQPLPARLISRSDET